MKKFLLGVLVALVLMVPSLVMSQTFTLQNGDTTTNHIVTTGVFHNDINPTGGPVNIKWHVIASNFPSDWLVDTVFGICDANLCRQNNLGMQLWNGTAGTPFNCQYTTGLSAVHTFDLNLNFKDVTTTGCYFVTVKLEDTIGSYSKNATFIVCKSPASVSTVTSTTSDVVLYPNPAKDEVNVVYDANADIKNIAVYNIIGKMMSVYKVAGNSANLNIENIPSGIYFVRLVNGHGNIVATKKFTKQ